MSKRMLIILLFFSSAVFSQVKFYETSDISISSDSGIVEFKILKNRNTTVPSNNLKYYWYSPRKIMVTKGGFHGKLLHGEYVEFYKNQQLKTKGNFKLGRKHGTWKKWNSDGTINSITCWKKGLLHGLTQSDFKNEETNKEVVYCKGDISNNKFRNFIIRLRL